MSTTDNSSSESSKSQSLVWTHTRPDLAAAEIVGDRRSGDRLYWNDIYRACRMEVKKLYTKLIWGELGYLYGVEIIRSDD